MEIKRLNAGISNTEDQGQSPAPERFFIKNLPLTRYEKI
jgi:hypothetical protein